MSVRYQGVTHPCPVAKPDPSVAEVHALFRHHVQLPFLLIGLATEVVLPPDVPHDSVGLGHLCHTLPQVYAHHTSL